MKEWREQTGVPCAEVTSLTAVDISNGMLTLAKDRADELGMRVLTEAEWAAALTTTAAAAAAAAAGSSPDGEGSDGSSAPPSPPPTANEPSPVRFMLANAEALPFPDASFDCVVGIVQVFENSVNQWL